MTDIIYTFSLTCPRCSKVTPYDTTQIAAPAVNCGDCLMDRTEVVEMVPALLGSRPAGAPPEAAKPFPTRAGFLAAYRAQVLATYPWAHDKARLDKFMAAVRATICGDGGAAWAWDGDATKRVWKALGGTEKLTLKALRALP